MLPFQYDIPWLDLSDSSLNGRYHSCPRKFELNKLYAHKRADYEDSIAAEAGKCLHTGWQTYMSSGSTKAGTWALMKDYPYHLNTTPMQARSIEALYATYLEMVGHPIDSRYQLASVIVDGVARHAVEVPFRIIFKDISLSTERHIPIRYIGYIDAILFDTVHQEYVVVDIKTTAKRRYDYSVMFGRDPQCLPYAYILEAIQGHAVTHLNVMYFIAFVDAMDPKVYKYDFVKSPSEVQSWGFNIAKDIKDIQMYASMGYFPKNGKACDTWSPCQYNNVCDYSTWESITTNLQATYGAPDWTDKLAPWFEMELSIEGLAA